MRERARRGVVELAQQRGDRTKATGVGACVQILYRKRHVGALAAVADAFVVVTPREICASPC